MKIFRLVLCAALCIGALQGHTKEYLGTGLALAPDETWGRPFKYVTYNSRVGLITTWDTKNTKPIAEIKTSKLAIAADWKPKKHLNSYCAIGLWDDKSRSISLYNGDTGSLVSSITKESSDEPIQVANFRTLAFNATEKFLASSIAEKTIDIIDVDSFKLVRTLKGHDFIIQELRFCPLKDKEHILASGSSDKNVCIWNAANGELLKTLKGHERVVNGGLAWHPEKYVLASGSFDGTVRIWDVAEGRPQLVLRHEGNIWAVAWSPDGRYLAVSVLMGMEKNHIRVWDLNNQRYKDFNVDSDFLPKIGWFTEKEIICVHINGNWQYLKPFADKEGWEEIDEKEFDENEIDEEIDEEKKEIEKEMTFSIEVGDQVVKLYF